MYLHKNLNQLERKLKINKFGKKINILSMLTGNKVIPIHENIEGQFLFCCPVFDLVSLFSNTYFLKGKGQSVEQLL